jgi:hypothetical protein
MAKSVSELLKFRQLQGAFAPLIPRLNALPVDPTGGKPLDPQYRIALRARHECCPHISNREYASIGS